MPDYSYAYDGVVLKLKDVNLSFGDKVVLKGINAEIKNITRPGMQQGQVVALLGPSGIGKTQLFRMMAGLATPGATRTGQVLLGNNDAPVSPGLVGVVAQNYPLFNHRTVLGNLVVAAKQAGKSAAQASEEAKAYLSAFDLAEHADKYPQQLSGGQRQRVAIAQQLICSEYFMLWDEPFSGLDPNMIGKVQELLQQITTRNEYNTTVLVTHDISSAIAAADTLWILGRDRDAAGHVIPGAYIKHQYDLIQEGLAWHPEIRKIPRFISLANEVRDLFPSL